MGSGDHQPLAEDGRRALAEVLPDTPENVIARHVLGRSLCKAWVLGPIKCFRAAIVQYNFLPAEPVGFGGDARGIVELLGSVEGWECVFLRSSLAPAVAEFVERQMGLASRLYGEVCFVLEEPVPSFEHEAVRLLGPQDAGLLSEAPPELQGAGWGNIETMLADGVAAAGIVDGRVVAIAHTSGHTRRYADIGVYTHEGHRNRGLSTAAASLVARRVQQLGLTPVWSTGCDNLASLRVAQKLGSTEVSRGTYVILDLAH